MWQGNALLHLRVTATGVEDVPLTLLKVTSAILTFEGDCIDYTIVSLQLQTVTMVCLSITYLVVALGIRAVHLIDVDRVSHAVHHDAIERQVPHGGLLRRVLPRLDPQPEHCPR